MIRNRLWNQHEDTFFKMRQNYKEFFELGDYKYLRNHNAWHGMKLIANQYQMARTELQGLEDPNEVARWINENQHRFFNVPLMHVFEDRKPVLFHKFEWMIFEPTFDRPINERFYHFQFFEEDLEGDGFRGELRIYIPYSPLRYDDSAVKAALASFGIYAFELSYGSNPDGRYLEARFVMLARDWKFPVDFNLWNLEKGKRPIDMTEDDFENMNEVDLDLDDIDPWEQIFDKLDDEDYNDR